MNSSEDEPVLEPRPTRPWYIQTIDNLGERSKARSELGQGHSSEISFDQVRLDQMAIYEHELFERATAKWWPSRAEREALKLIKNHSPQVRGYYEQRIIQRRMDYLREKDRQAYWRSIQPDVSPTLRERMTTFLKRQFQPEQER